MSSVGLSVEAERANHEHRLLILAPFGRDARLVSSVLGGAGIDCTILADLPELVVAIRQGAAAAVIAEEALRADTSSLLELIDHQAPWSDLPILLLTGGRPHRMGHDRRFDLLGNVVLLDRPIRIATLISAATNAIRARARQYETRSHLRALQDADQRKDVFLATLAHELRNPLAPIRNAVELLALSSRLDHTLARSVAMIGRQAALLERLVDDLLEISRITRGVIEIRREPIALATVIESAIDSVRPLIDLGQHRFELELPVHAVHFNGDPVRLAQVFANLLTNAVKYTEPGGTIALRSTVNRKHIIVRVIDSGIGIDAADLTRIFDMFAQAAPLSRRAQGGLGVGLTLVRSLVQLHGGTITATSPGHGRGSEFTVTLPIDPLIEPVSSRAAGESGSVPAPAAHLGASGGDSPRSPMDDSHLVARRDGKPLRIVVVDDNVDAALSLAELLEQLGEQTEVAHDGAQALASVEASLPDLMFIDIGMPEMDGYELARRMRSGQLSGDRASGIQDRDASAARPPMTCVPVLVALTGWGQHRDRIAAMKAGFDHHLVKPASLADLKHVIDMVAGTIPRRHAAAVANVRTG